MKKKYALIGCGMMGTEHIHNVNLLDGAEVAHVYDPVPALAAKAAAVAGGATVHDTFESIISEKSLDAFIIASPNFVHADQLITISSKQRVPVLCEKPLFTNKDDEVKLRQLFRGGPVPVWVAMEYRYMPPLAEFISSVDRITGGIDMLSIREHRYPFLEKVGDWNRFNENTGGTFVEKCCHFFDLMRLILKAEPTRVMASGGQVNNHLDEDYDGRTPDIWDSGYILVDFDSGARALLDLCMFAEGSTWNEEISAVGKRGKIECKIPGPQRFWQDDWGPQPAPKILEYSRTAAPLTREIAIDENLLSAGDHHGSTYFQHKRFLQFVCGELPKPDVTLEDGIQAVRMGMAAQDSVKLGRIIKMT